jgi:hypothetical protein
MFSATMWYQSSFNRERQHNKHGLSRCFGGSSPVDIHFSHSSGYMRAAPSLRTGVSRGPSLHHKLRQTHNLGPYVQAGKTRVSGRRLSRPSSSRTCDVFPAICNCVASNCLVKSTGHLASERFSWSLSAFVRFSYLKTSEIFLILANLSLSKSKGRGC